MLRKEKLIRRAKRHKRIRAKILGTPERPRLNVFKSNKHLYGQLIDDSRGITLASASDREVEKKENQKPKDLALELGRLLAQKAKRVKLESIIFDRGGYKYHGIIKNLADGARKGGLKF